MDLKFQHALFAAGTVLIGIGIFSLLADVSSSAPVPGALAAFSRGFDTIFLSLFSGVLMGIGIALAGNGFILYLPGSKRRTFVSGLFSILFLSLSTLAVFFREASPLFALVCFFSFILASTTFLVTTIWHGLSGAVRKYLPEMK